LWRNYMQLSQMAPRRRHSPTLHRSISQPMHSWLTEGRVATWGMPVVMLLERYGHQHPSHPLGQDAVSLTDPPSRAQLLENFALTVRDLIRGS